MGSGDLGLVGRFGRILGEVAEAARHCGRDPAGITVVAVSKWHPAQDIEALFQAGHVDYGESYAQEALDKMAALAGFPLRWHFVGGLQTNKAKYVAGRFALVHSLDSVRLAEALARAARNRFPGQRQAVLLQVNLAGEEKKSGAPEQEALGLAEAVQSMPELDLRGLMVMPPYDPDPERTRPYFARLRELRNRIEHTLGARLPDLSMGMSHDFVPAVEEGATLVRIGTAIFGERPERSTFSGT